MSKKSVLIVLLLAVTLVCVLMLFEILNQDEPKKIEPIISTNTPIVCPPKPSIPEGYEFKNEMPLNSFYGITLKDGQGRVCEIIFGPDYSVGYEGFTGTQIQINSYSKELATLEDLIMADRATELQQLESQLKYTRPSYGGEDEVLIFETEASIIQLIWRNTDKNTQLEQVVLDIATQITNAD